MDEQTKGQFTIIVNGIEIKVNHEKLVAADVLKLAADHEAISGKPNEYVLESDDPKHEFKNDDWVDFHEYKKFTAERSAPTPVAEACQHE
jgi:hypothetical protein